MSTSTPSSLSSRLQLLRIVTLGGLFAGMAISWKLWLNSGRDFPLTPVSENLPLLPNPVDWIFFLAVVPLGILFVWKPEKKLYAWLLIGLMLILALQDQNRWQPWFYQYLLTFILFTVFDARKEKDASLLFTLLAVMTAATYIWSGLQKWTPGFLTDTYTWLLQPFFPKAMLARIAWTGYIFAALEGLGGLALLFRRTRRTGIVFLLAMHAFILIALGPLGQNYNYVVFPWNILMVAWIIILFGKKAPPLTFAPLKTALRRPLAALIFALYCLIPALDFFNCWDSYLALNLYSGNTSSGFTYFLNGNEKYLPAPYHKYLKKTHDGEPYIDHKEWSLNELSVPTFPSRRIYVNVHHYLMELTGQKLLFCFDEKRSLLGKPENEWIQ